jgi:hypothetical protein
MNLQKPWKELGVLVGIGRRLHHVSGLLYAKKNLVTRLGKKQPHDIDATKINQTFCALNHQTASGSSCE